MAETPTNLISKSSEGSDTLTINPVEMGITNRIAAGCTCVGHHQYQGGILVQGSLGGHIKINGDLVLWAGGMLEGDIELTGNLYLFGQVGTEDQPQNSTTIRARGIVYAAHSCLSYGTIYGQYLRLYQGAQILGPFMTVGSPEDELAEDIQDQKAFQPS